MRDAFARLEKENRELKKGSHSQTNEEKEDGWTFASLFKRKKLTAIEACQKVDFRTLTRLIKDKNLDINAIREKDDATALYM